MARRTETAWHADNDGMTLSLSEALTERPGQRRAFQRYRVSLTVLVQPEAENGVRRRAGVTTALVTNASLSGLVFVSSRPHPPGSLVEIQVSLGAHVHRVRAVVRRSRTLTLPGRRAFECAAQLVRGEEVTRFIPALARHLYQRRLDRDAPTV